MKKLKNYLKYGLLIVFFVIMVMTILGTFIIATFAREYLEFAEPLFTIGLSSGFLFIILGIAFSDEFKRN